MCVAEDRAWTCPPAPGAHALGKEVKVSLSLSHTHTHTHVRLNNRERLCGKSTFLELGLQRKKGNQGCLRGGGSVDLSTEGGSDYLQTTSPLSLTLFS